MEPDLIVEMRSTETSHRFLNLPHTFKSSIKKREWKVLFKAVKGSQCLAPEGASNVIEGDLKPEPRSFDAIPEGAEQLVTLKGTHGSWSFLSCEHAQMGGEIFVEPPMIQVSSQGFEPHELAVEPGETIFFRNVDGELHSIETDTDRTDEGVEIDPVRLDAWSSGDQRVTISGTRGSWVYFCGEHDTGPEGVVTLREGSP